MFLILPALKKQTVPVSYLVLGWMTLGLLAIMGAVWLGSRLSPAGTNRPAAKFAIALCGYLLIIVLRWIWLVYNSLVTFRQRVRQGWGGGRHRTETGNDLIPNLVQVVEGYAAHESKITGIVTNLRGQMSATPPV